MTCEHLSALGVDPAEDPKPLSLAGCDECLAMGLDDWVHLRLCLSCGNVGCCDSSPRRQASAHHAQTEHPVIRSFQPGEDWRWCYLDEEVG